MKKLHIYCLVLLLLSTLVFSLSCSQKDLTNDVHSSETTAPATEDNELTIFENNAYNCVIVYPDNATASAENTAFSLSYYFSMVTNGISPKVVSDKEYEGVDTSEMNMILVDKTSVSGTEVAFENADFGTVSAHLIGNKYQIVVNDNKAGVAAILRIRELLGNAPLTEIIINENWEFSSVFNETLSMLDLYKNGTAGDTVDCGDGAYMKVITDTNEEAFEHYLKTSGMNGYSLYTRTEIGENSFATLTSDGYVMTAIFLPIKNEARLIIEPREITELPALESDNVYETVCSSSVTQLGLENGEEYQNGMCYILKLSDGRFVVIDGGFNQEFVLERFMKTLKDLAEDPDNITIAAWFITHFHSDHWGLLNRVSKNPNIGIEIEQIICNLPDDDFVNRSDDEVPSTSELSSRRKNFNAAMDIFRDTGSKVIKAHPGQKFHLGNMVFTVYGTCELFSVEEADNLNNSCLLLYVEAEGQTLLFPADSAHIESASMVELYGEYLKADFLQVIHHGYGGGDSSYYEFVDPQIVFWPIGIYDYQVAKENVRDRVINEYFKRENGTSVKEIHIAGDSVITIPLPYSTVTADR